MPAKESASAFTGLSFTRTWHGGPPHPVPFLSDFPRYAELMRLLLLPVFCIGFALAATQRAELLPGQTYTANVTYSQTVTILSVDVQPKANVRLSAQSFTALKQKYQARAKTTLADLNAGFELILSGKAEIQDGQAVLPLQATLNASKYSATSPAQIVIMNAGYPSASVVPLVSLMWKGKGQPPLAQIRNDVSTYTRFAVMQASTPFGYDTAQPQTVEDRLPPAALGLVGVTEDLLLARSVLSWPTPNSFKITTTASAQAIAGPRPDIKVRVISAALVSQGQVEAHWPVTLGAGGYTQLNMTLPTDQTDPVTVSVRFEVTSRWQQIWSTSE